MKEVVAAVDGLSSVETADDLSRLQELAETYFAAPDAADYLEVWFRLFERFPEDDGSGVFWTILHGIEAMPGCQPLIVQSIRRRPSRFPAMMVNRLLNGRVRQVDDVDLMELLRQVAADQQCSPSVREAAKGYLDHQQSRA